MGMWKSKHDFDELWCQIHQALVAIVKNLAWTTPLSDDATVRPYQSKQSSISGVCALSDKREESEIVVKGDRLVREQ